MNQTHAPRMEEVVSLLEKHGESTVETLAEHAEGSPEELRRAINRLEERDVVNSRVNPLNPYQKLRSLSGEQNE